MANMKIAFVGFGILGVTIVYALMSGAGEPPRRGSASAASPEKVRVRVIGKDGKLTQPVEMAKLVLPDEVWRARLTPEQFRITRSKGTERAFCGGLLDNKKPGLYACICCDLPLFASTAKFKSGTGWPSFFQPVARENILERPDYSHNMVRVEILCKRCEAHLGHVFRDGPRPTGLRYCLNSEALRFVPEKEIASMAEYPVSQSASSGSQTRSDRAELVIAGGCFWCVEAVFEQLEGVIDVVSGYSGGRAETANYPAVCTGRTGHAEAVKIEYDPTKISMETLLKVHFETHDPTTLNRQGNDIGPQYRSAIFYADEKEKALAQAFLEDLTEAKVFRKPIVTTLEPLKAFYPAEKKHQDFVACNPRQPYVRSIALPKVKKVRAKFEELIKKPESRRSR